RSLDRFSYWSCEPIGENSPVGLVATRVTMRGDISERVREAMDHDLAEQTQGRRLQERGESGVRAVAPEFQGIMSPRLCLHACDCVIEFHNSSSQVYGACWLVVRRPYAPLDRTPPTHS